MEKVVTSQPNPAYFTQGSFFSKTGELPKGSQTDFNHRLSTAANSIQKIPSTTNTLMSDRSRKRGSLFSSFAEMRKSSQSFHTSPVPRVKISAIIQKNSHKYFDASLAQSMDGLLEDSYNIVLNRKNQRKELLDEEQELLEQIRQLEMDILPEMNRFSNLREAVRSAKEQQEAYRDGLKHYENEIEKTNQTILERKLAIQHAGERYLQNIKDVDHHIHVIKTETFQNKERHQKEIEDAKSEISIFTRQREEVKTEVAALKVENEKIKATHTDKVRKIENKTRMFLGLLKHQ